MGAVDPAAGRWGPLLWLVVLAGVLAAARYHPFRRVEVVGSSMVPALLPGDRLVVLRVPWRSPFRPKPGQVVALRDPRRPDRILIKRVRSVDLGLGTLEVEGDARRAQHRQPLVRPRIPLRHRRHGRSTATRPRGRNGPVPGPGEYDRA